MMVVMFAFMMVLVLMFVFMSMHVIFVVMLVVVIVFVLMRMFVIVVIMRMFMAMLMHVLVFFNTIYNDMRMCAFDAALDALFEVICDTGNTQRIELIFTCFYAARKLGKRC